MKSFDIPAYVFQADLICEHCIAVAFESESGPSIFDGAEAILDARADERGLDRHAEETFDSDDFPKVAFADSLNEDDRCGQCGSTLL